MLHRPKANGGFEIWSRLPIHSVCTSMIALRRGAGRYGTRWFEIADLVSRTDWSWCKAPAYGLLVQLKGSHHPEVFVVQDVAVKDGETRVVGEAGSDPHP